MKGGNEGVGLRYSWIFHDHECSIKNTKACLSFFFCTAAHSESFVFTARSLTHGQTFLESSKDCLIAVYGGVKLTLRPAEWRRVMIW